MTTCAANRDQHHIQMPYVTEPTLPTTQGTGVRRSELPAPPANGLVGHGDAALGKEILDIAQAQRESMVQPNGMADNLRWEAVASIKGVKR